MLYVILLSFGFLFFIFAFAILILKSRLITINDQHDCVLIHKIINVQTIVNSQFTIPNIQRIGLVTSATGEIKDLCRSPAFKSPLKKLCTVGIPSFTTDELHVALITGTYVGYLVIALRIQNSYLDI